jgi:hypothetical protein
MWRTDLADPPAVFGHPTTPSHYPRQLCHSLTTYLRHIKKIAGLPLAEWLLKRHLVDGDCRHPSDPHRGA